MRQQKIARRHAIDLKFGFAVATRNARPLLRARCIRIVTTGGAEGERKRTVNLWCPEKTRERGRMSFRGRLDSVTTRDFPFLCVRVLFVSLFRPTSCTRKLESVTVYSFPPFTCASLQNRTLRITAVTMTVFSPEKTSLCTIVRGFRIQRYKRRDSFNRIDYPSTLGRFDTRDNYTQRSSGSLL